MNLKEYSIDLRRFDGENVNVTTDSDLSAEMRTFYSDYLIDNASPKLVHDQFGQKQPVAKNGGKTVQFRKYSPLPKATTPLTEGVTPSGRKLNVTGETAEIAQYGDYVELSDMLLLTAIDNNIVQATKLLGAQAGATLDTIVREVINGGTNVQYADDSVSARHLLVGGKESGNNYLTVSMIKRAARKLKAMNAEKIDGAYVAIIHPDVAYDLMHDPDWVNASEYAGSCNIFEGEIGKIAGVRFVETSEAKIFYAEPLSTNFPTLTVKNEISSSSASIVISEAVPQAELKALIGKPVIINSQLCTVREVMYNANGSSIILQSSISAVPAGTVIYSGAAGADGRAVYSTPVLGENAYGTTEIEGGGLTHITKQLGSAGSGDPLNQRATVGWKATKAAKRLVEGYMVRIETTSTFNG